LTRRDILFRCEYAPKLKEEYKLGKRLVAQHDLRHQNEFNGSIPLRQMDKTVVALDREGGIPTFSHFLPDTTDLDTVAMLSDATVRSLQNIPLKWVFGITGTGRLVSQKLLPYDPAILASHD